MDHVSQDLTRDNELAFSSTSNLQFYRFQILKLLFFYFSLFYKQGVGLNDMLVTYYGKAMLHRVDRGRFPFDENSGNSGWGSRWNRHFPEFHSEILGVLREVGLRFRKIVITGKFCSIRPFLLGPSFSKLGNRTTWRELLVEPV